MTLIVGLGNPGTEFEDTPHNLGQLCALAYAAASGLTTPKLERKFDAFIAEGTVGKHKVILATPDTFMNNSGDSVAAISQFYKIPPEDIWVLHDEADIPLGNIRIAFGASPAGHNGVKSIAEKLRTKDFWRFRIGIAPPEPLIMPLEAYVLKKGAIGPEQAVTITDKTIRLIGAAFQNGIAETKKEAD